MLGRTAVAVFAAITLVAGAPRPAASSAPIEADPLEQVLGDALGQVQLLVFAIPDPPETPEQAASVASFAKAETLVHRALAKPSTLGLVKASGKADRLLRKAWPADGAIAPVLQDLADGNLAWLGKEAGDLRALVEILPADAARDALLDAVDLLIAGIDDVPWDGSPASYAPLYSDLGSLAARLKGAWKKHGKLLAVAAGRKGLTAVVEGVPFAPKYLTGNILEAPWGVKQISLIANPEEADQVISLALYAAEGGIVPGVYAVGPGTFEGFYDEVAGIDVDRFTFTSGTVTILRLDTSTGTVAGTFSVTGFNGESEVTIELGRFHATGLAVIPAL